MWNDAFVKYPFFLLYPYLFYVSSLCVAKNTQSDYCDLKYNSENCSRILWHFRSTKYQPPLTRGSSSRAWNENSRLKVSFISSLTSCAPQRSSVSERKRGNGASFPPAITETIFYVARKAELGDKDRRMGIYTWVNIQYHVNADQQ